MVSLPLVQCSLVIFRQGDRGLYDVVLRMHYMTFLLRGDFASPASRVAGVRRVFNRPMEQVRARYGIIGAMVMVRSLLDLLHFGRKCCSGNPRPPRPPPVPPSRFAAAEPGTGKGEVACALCLAPVNTPTATECGHVFCWTCVYPWMRRSRRCPVCRMPGTASSLLCLRNL